jgi:hypothetical protein
MPIKSKWYTTPALKNVIKSRPFASVTVLVSVPFRPVLDIMMTRMMQELLSDIQRESHVAIHQPLPLGAMAIVSKSRPFHITRNAWVSLMYDRVFRAKTVILPVIVELLAGLVISTPGALKML